MKIEIVSIDGMGVAAEVWRLSRDVEKSVQWEDVYCVDGPVTEFPSAVIHFKDFTILEREIFCSSRTHVAWARTSFVDDPQGFQIPREFWPLLDQRKQIAARSAMIESKQRGEHQDRWRRTLPIQAQTCWCMRLSYREAVKYAKYFDYLSTRVHPRLYQRFKDIKMELMYLIDKFTGSASRTQTAFETLTLAKFLHEDKVEASPIVNVGGLIVASFEVPLWLRAHWIRHRPITVIDDLFQLMQQEEILDMTISQPMTLRVAASENIWRQLLRWRSCWLTQSSLVDEIDPWAAVIHQFTEFFGASLLPCSDGICPQAKDAQARVDGNDPGVVCPRYLSLKKIDPAPHMERIKMALKSRAPFWTKMVEEL